MRSVSEQPFDESLELENFFDELFTISSHFKNIERKDLYNFLGSFEIAFHLFRERMRCQSPIEWRLYLALFLLSMILQKRFNHWCCTISPQRKFKPYTIDIEVSWDVHSHGQIGLFAIECDGHDFHERTVEQAIHDKKRDRFLQSNGFHVFRVTGREINSDSVGIAISLFIDMIKTLQNKLTCFPSIPIPQRYKNQLELTRDILDGGYRATHFGYAVSRFKMNPAKEIEWKFVDCT